MIHSIQCSQNPANNSRGDANTEANVKFFKIGEMNIMETISYIHILVQKLYRYWEQVFIDYNLYLESSGNSKV